VAALPRPRRRAGADGRRRHAARRPRPAPHRVEGRRRPPAALAGGAAARV